MTTWQPRCERALHVIDRRLPAGDVERRRLDHHAPRPLAAGEGVDDGGAPGGAVAETQAALDVVRRADRIEPLGIVGRAVPPRRDPDDAPSEIVGVVQELAPFLEQTYEAACDVAETDQRKIDDHAGSVSLFDCHRLLS